MKNKYHPNRKLIKNRVSQFRWQEINIIKISFGRNIMDKIVFFVYLMKFSSIKKCKRDAYEFFNVI